MCDNTKARVFVVYRVSDNKALLTTLNRDEAVGRAVREKAYAKEYTLSMYGSATSDLIHNPGWREPKESWFYEDAPRVPRELPAGVSSRSSCSDAVYEEVE